MQVWTDEYMPRVFFFIIFVSAMILVLGLAELLLLRWLNRVWWNKKWLRRAAWSLPILGILFFLLFILGEYSQVKWLSTLAGPLCILAVMLEISLMFSLPFSGAIHLVNNFIDHQIRHRQKDEPATIDERRRLFLQGAAAVVPLAALSTGLSGVARAFGGVNVFGLPLQYDNLPPELEGLKILHLSDMHLRQYVTLDDLAQVMADAAKFSPDLILVTGDIADDIDQLPAALELVAEANPPLGAFACLGNHEHFRGLTAVHEAFGQSDVSLLVNQQVSIPTGDRSLTLAGIDDPVSMRNVRPEFFEEALNSTMQKGQPGDFSILMSHRPAVFAYAATQGVNLTLAGHTHGGQLGLWGRSLLETYFPEAYLWGKYKLGASQLYTSCGVGHWFPWRLGCPPEAPVIELRKTDQTA